MNLKKGHSLFSLSFAVLILYAAWKTKNFGFLLLSSAFLMIFFALTWKRLSTFLLPIIVTMALLSAVEFSLPLLVESLGEQKRKEEAYYDKNSDYMKDFNRSIKHYGNIPKKGTHTSRKLTVDGDVIYDVIYTIGEDGFRKSGAESDFLVHLFGGSYAFGEGLNDNETLSHYLYSDHGLHVKNLGVSANGLHQALYSIEVNQYSARDGVNLILTAPFHVSRSACKKLYATGSPKYYVDNGYAKLDGVCPLPGLQYLYKPNIVSRVLHRSNILRIISSVFFEKITVEDIDLYLSIIRSIKRETDKSNSKLLIAYIRSDHIKQFEKYGYTNEILIRKISEIADKVVDVTLALDGEELDKKYYLHELDGHPTAEANRERASLLASPIISLLDMH